MKKFAQNFKISFLLLLSILFVACQGQNTAVDESSASSESQEVVSFEEPDPAVDQTVTIRSIGDILIHDTVYQAAYTGDGYDFSSMFAPVAKYIGGADITTANLEVIAAGNQLGVSSYPFFNAPEEIIDALQDVGVDIVNNATNHTLDFGAEGAHASIDALQERDMMYFGSYDSWEDYNTPRIIEVGNVKVGFLSYANDANGNYIPEDEPYLFTQIDQELIPLEIERINEMVDISIVNYHMGQEYEYYPNEWQEENFQLAWDAGANFVLGGHPHVLQPFAQPNESQGGIYSHANFLSGQYEVDTKLGGIIEYTFRVKGEDVTLEGMRFMPTYNLGLPESAQYLVVPLAEAADYGFWDADYYFDVLTERMTTYTDNVEVVPYLD
ncbi:hypothetical protein CL176_05865 [Suicoccus acidiformans]|uniref:Capsule synthesis protein CapA domain-containing protein n=1 Tax=Suicoccus acidiformans TaxID=2036206 RepID=A0A347WKF0_9LACT|nr:CapA family protein [Suicoccus acidiformans]AXY25557.1 hypothetical protein CL176_05865 [Suicoccus acidiformans]